MTDTHQYTQNEARAEILEKRKAEIDAEIADLRMYQAVANATRWAQLDAEIDALLLAKDNLTSGLIVDEEFIDFLEEDGSDTSWSGQLEAAGYGSGGVL